MRKETRAYIAGFLDGDGSIIFQIVRRKDYVLGFQIRPSVCFYQKSTSAEILGWLKAQLHDGYTRRHGEMSDYTIVGRDAVLRVLRLVGPYVVAKRRQVKAGLEILRMLGRPTTEQSFLRAAESVDKFAQLNYSKNKKVSVEEVRRYLGAKKQARDRSSRACCRSASSI
jgi:hypothetical protein